MTKRNVAALRRALAGPPGSHLNAERLAELAAAEAAGEPVEQFYPATLAHLEHCLDCATAYSQLVSLSTAATQEMAAAADAVSPQAIYTAVLKLTALAQVGQNLPAELETAIERLVALLPTYYTATPQPEPAAEVNTAPLQAAIQQIIPTDSPLSARLVALVRQNIPALAAYLEQAAAEVWQQVENLQLTIAGRPQGFRLITPPTLPALRERTIPYHASEPPIEVDVSRLSPLACRLTVQVGPGIKGASSWTVVVDYTNDHLTAVTDQTGIAYFEPIPIAALSSLNIHITNFLSF